MVLVLDDIGTILQVEGSSLAMIGYNADSMIGDNALEYVAPEHFEPMMFVFAGPGDHVLRDRHAPFPLQLIGSDGERLTVDCAAHRVRNDGRTLWVVTMMPHQLQSASFHALAAYGRGASPHEVAETIAERLSWQWDPGAEIRSFLLTDHVDGRFTVVSEPGRTPPSELLDAFAQDVGRSAPWNVDVEGTHIILPVDDLPAAVADAARNAGFEIAAVAIGRLGGEPRLGLVSFGIHRYAFEGNLEMIMAESVRTLDMALEREAAEQALREAAERDALTGLSNRHRFTAALDERDPGESAILFIDLDHFKRVNDDFGHTVGDDVLVEVARRIRSLCRPDDVIARLGGDEFAVLLGAVDPTTAERRAHRILARIADPLPEGVGPERIAASGGLATTMHDDDAVKRADLAMLASKRAGRAQLVIA